MSMCLISDVHTRDKAYNHVYNGAYNGLAFAALLPVYWWQTPETSYNLYNHLYNCPHNGLERWPPASAPETCAV